MANREAYVTGVGQSQVGVRLTRHPLLLTADAAKEALAEAGLTTAQIDGVATYPGRAGAFLGYSPVGTDDVIEGLGLKPTWYIGAGEVTSQQGAIVAAADAVRQGHARHVLCYRTVYEAAALARPEEYPPLRRDKVEGWSQWTAPFNAISAACWVAQYANRHVKKYGMTREQLAQVALTGRANAALNPRAVTNSALTMDEYMSSRLITTPFCLHDCDRFTDGSTVLIISAGEAINEVKCTPIRIAAAASQVDRFSWDQPEWPASYQTGPRLWTKTDYKPKDVDVVQFYDGFSFLAIAWFESLGFCKIGEGHKFVEGGKRIARDGELPMNTFGGQIGQGRLHGFGFPYEAVVQLRGTAGARQVPNNPKVAIATSGGGPLATAVLFARD